MIIERSLYHGIVDIALSGLCFFLHLPGPVRNVNRAQYRRGEPPQHAREDVVDDNKRRHRGDVPS